MGNQDNWASGCEECENGLLDPPPIKGSTYEVRRLQNYMGELTFCTCKAGQAYKAYMKGQGTLWVDDATEMARDQAQARKRAQAKTFKHGEVPPKFQALTLEGYLALAGKDPGKKQLILALSDYMANGFVMAEGEKKYGICLWGDSDKGKTGALSPVFLHCIQKGMTGLWMQYNTMLSELKDFDSGNVKERMDACKLCDVLFIDDLADPEAKDVTDHTRGLIFEIIDYRNNYQKITFITSNASPKKLGELFHPRIPKRIAESCAEIEVKGKSMAQLKKEAKQ